MVKILEKQRLAEGVNRFLLEAPDIAKKALPGQFVSIRPNETGERIPVTISEADKDRGTLTLIIQAVGKTTIMMGDMKVGDTLTDVIGPLGRAAEIEKVGTVVTIGGGVGTAIVYPETRAFKEAGNYVISIIGFRNKELVILEDKMKSVSDEIHITTDDGSYGRKGFVSDELKDIIDSGKKVNLVIAIGPAVMMKVVCDLTEKYGIHTIVSLNSIMVDGTGMCGACRVEIDGKTKFACIDGPEFDGHLVNFDLLMKRLNMYKDMEKISLEKYLKERRV